jgi:hypothetical protein
MAPWELHEMFPSLDINNVPGYPNHFSSDWGNDCPKLDGDLSSAITHVVKFLKYTSKINVIHKDVLIRLFLISLEARQKNWVKHSCSPKSISSLAVFIEEFLKWWGPIFQRYEDTFQDLTTVLREEGFFYKPIQDDEDLIEDQGHDDDPIGERILPHEDKGMVSSTPFQVFDLCDASFDDLESKEFSEKHLDLVNFLFDKEHDDHEIENFQDLNLCPIFHLIPSWVTMRYSSDFL